MKKCAVFVLLFTVCMIAQAMDQSLTMAKQDRPIPCCKFGSSVPPCEKCIQGYFEKNKKTDPCNRECSADGDKGGLTKALKRIP